MLAFLPALLDGMVVTILVTGAAAAIALVMAFGAAVMLLSRLRPLRVLARTYVEVFRGTSAMVQLFWIFFVLPHFGVTISPFAAGSVALGLNIGAYGAEIVRGAIVAVPIGQIEAARALCLSHRQTMWRIVIPQAAVAMVPPWGNLMIELLKATALVSLITLADLTFVANQINQATFRTTEIFTLVLFLYFGLALLITAGMRRLERALRRGRPGPGAA